MDDNCNPMCSLVAGQASPFELVNETGQSHILLLCEHAGRTIPTELGTLGLSDDERTSHIAWDIGARALSILLSRHLDATLAMQRYSRLVYDCNREWGAPDEAPEKVDFINVPGNCGLDAANRLRRRKSIYEPFHQRVREIVGQRQSQERQTVVVTIHSFTPVYQGRRRTVDIGIVHDTDQRLADIMLNDPGLPSEVDIQRNEPYGPDRGVTHTLKVQAIAYGLLNVMIEVRNDHIADRAGQAKSAGLLAPWIGRSVSRAVQEHVMVAPIAES